MAANGGLTREYRCNVARSVDSTVRLHGEVELAGDITLQEYVVIGRGSGAPQEQDATRIAAGGLIRSHSVIYSGVLIGEQFHCGHQVLIRESTTIGDRVSIGSHSVIEHHVIIESDVRIHSNAFVPEFSRLCAGCWVGPGVVLTNAKYPRSPGVKNHLAGPTIHRGAKIGANATILPGVVIGADALIGAGSVVTRDVPPRTVVAGNPARVINTLDALPYAPAKTEADPAVAQLLCAKPD